MNLKQYKKLNTIRIDAITDYTRALGLLRVENISLLLTNNRDNFMKLWGKQDFCFTSEYRHWVWARDYEGEMFFVWSGKQGTSIEVAYSPLGLKKLGPKAIAFALTLIVDLKAIGAKKRRG